MLFCVTLDGSDKFVEASDSGEALRVARDQTGHVAHQSVRAATEDEIEAHAAADEPVVEEKVSGRKKKA